MVHLFLNLFCLFFNGSFLCSLFFDWLKMFRSRVAYTTGKCPTSASRSVRECCTRSALKRSIAAPFITAWPANVTYVHFRAWALLWVIIRSGCLPFSGLSCLLVYMVYKGVKLTANVESQSSRDFRHVNGCMLTTISSVVCRLIKESKIWACPVIIDSINQEVIIKPDGESS